MKEVDVYKLGENDEHLQKKRKSASEYMAKIIEIQKMLAGEGTD
jgi:hypothetical protein